jgi:hypothetical protein
MDQYEVRSPSTWHGSPSLAGKPTGGAWPAAALLTG